MFTLEALGWTTERARGVSLEADVRPARVASVYAARVEVWEESGSRLASLRSRALRADVAQGGIAVGDWVLVKPTMAHGDEVVVETVLPRTTVMLRQAAGERAEPQAIAANVERVFIVTSVEGDFNVRRLERYLLAVGAGGAEARIVLTKADLRESLDDLVTEASALAPVLVTSARDGRGLDALVSEMPPGTTSAFVGSSGVGKSALVNCLLGRGAQREGEVREHDGRGRHTTTRRAMFALENGGLVIDTPGMRELTPWLSEEDEPSKNVYAALADQGRGRASPTTSRKRRPR